MKFNIYCIFHTELSLMTFLAVYFAFLSLNSLLVFWPSPLGHLNTTYLGVVHNLTGALRLNQKQEVCSIYPQKF